MSSPQATLLNEQSLCQIRSRPNPDCYLCGAPGKTLHEHVADRLFGADGRWSLKRCPDPRCRLVWLDPMPLEEDIGKAYRSYYTHRGDSRDPDNFARDTYQRMKASYLSLKYKYHPNGNSLWDRVLGRLVYLSPIRRESIEGSVFYLHAKHNGRLLEVGCGAGSTLKLLQDFGWQVEGVDFDPPAVEEASKKGLKVHLGTLSEQELPSGSFDAIVSNHVIEHVPDPVGLLRECHRLLKPGGNLVVITPNAGSWGHRIYGAQWRGLEPPRHLHIFTVPSLATTCTRAGFAFGDCRSLVRANGALLASRMLRRTGRVDLASRHSVRVRLLAEAIGLAQWTGSLVDHEAGEEIVLISRK
jgi:2-polyprenyl-3-methyl-5-hydroxy-6-metoxy-1,4-benzoquinol methylase